MNMLKNTWSIVTTVKAPDEIIHKFITHYLDLGADHLYIYLDDPDSQKIHKTIENKKVKFILCDNNFWRERKHYDALEYEAGVRPDYVEFRQYHNLLQTAEECASDWLLNIDIDELLYSINDIGITLARIPDNVFSALVRPVEAIYKNTAPRKPKDIFNTIYFKSRKKVDYAFWDTIYADKNIKHKSGFFGHVTGKSFIRTSIEITRPSCHLPFPSDKSYALGYIIESMFILHFEAMTLPLFIKKMMNRVGKVYNTPFLEKTIKERTKYLTDKYQEKGEKFLKNAYKDMNIFDDDRLSTCMLRGYVININDLKYNRNKLLNRHGDVLVYSYKEKTVRAIDNQYNCNENYSPIYMVKDHLETECYLGYINKRGDSCYIQVQSNANLTQTDNHSAEIFSIEKDENGLFSIKLKEKTKYLSSNKRGDTKFIRDEIKAWEKFYLA